MFRDKEGQSHQRECISTYKEENKCGMRVRVNKRRVEMTPEEGPNPGRIVYVVGHNEWFLFHLKFD